MRAIDAAIRVAEAFGIQVLEPVLLRSTNNIVAWLHPAPIVAKIGVGQHRGFRREVWVASELSALGGPVVAPAPELPAIVHSQDEFEITFWQYHPQASELNIPDSQVAAALHNLHAAYAMISAELRADLPSYSIELEPVAKLLCDATRVPALPDEDRHLLLRVFYHLRMEMQQRSAADTHKVIHGSPHPFNILLVDGEPRFIDFETTCTGPAEWDLAHMTSDIQCNSFASTANAKLLRICSDMVRVKTAAWCWADIDRGDLRYHAEVHLAYIKEQFPEHV